MHPEIRPWPEFVAGVGRKRAVAAQTPGGSAPLRLAIAAAAILGLRTRYRFEVRGRLPRHRGPTLIVANHQHDLESVVVPGLALLRRPWRDPVFAIASQRLFERGFLTPRAPRPLRRLVRNWSLERLLGLVGALPLENEPRSRALASFAQEVAAASGDLPAGEVFAGSVLDGRAGAGARLSDLWGPVWAEEAQVRVSALALREPYRSEVRARLRPRLQAQLAHIEQVLRRGATIYVTPEGRVTPDGHFGRLHAVIDRLLPVAGRSVYLACVNYDPFLYRRLALRCRIVPLRDPGCLQDELCGGRWLCVSQLLAAWLAGRGADRPFSAADAATGVDAQIAGLPDGVLLAPDLEAAGIRRGVVGRALATMVRLGYLRREGEGYARTDQRHDDRLHEAADIFAHQVAVLEETCAAVRRLACRAGPQTVR